MDIIDRIIDQLGSEDEVVRVQAGEALLMMGSAAVRPLIQALENRNQKGRHLIAATLGYLGDMRAVEPLIRALRDRDPVVRYHSALALGKLRDKRAIQPLIYSLFDETPPLGPDPLTGEVLTVRGAAALALGDLQATEAVEPLKVVLRSDLRSLRLAVAQSLARIPCQEAVSVLVEHLKTEKDPEIKRLIVRLLKKSPFFPAGADLKQIIVQSADPEIQDALTEEGSTESEPATLLELQPETLVGSHPREMPHPLRKHKVPLAIAVAVAIGYSLYQWRPLILVISALIVWGALMIWSIVRHRRRRQKNISKPEPERTSSPV
ncbi:MAG: HEAT repeat domain-containing protein [Armatimonadetes bacterium]|nr:HEAT repeat domain-containing protein [Armatimonadota bacterium]MDW8121715.1 HEAT repeat domain-containing protein [Armatimonadota bacterium]